MTPKHVMHAALVASLMTSFLVACAPSKNPKAKGIRAGTHKTAPASKKQANLALGKAGLGKVTKSDEEISKRLLGASAAVTAESKSEKKDGKETETIKASVSVKAIILNKEGKEEVIIASGGVDEINKALKIGAVNGCGEEAKYDVEVSCSKEACKALTVAISEKDKTDAKIPMLFKRIETDGEMTYELSYTAVNDDKNEVVRNSIEDVVASLEAGKLTCADPAKSTDPLTAKVDGVPSKQEEVDAKNEPTKPTDEVKTEGGTKPATEEKTEGSKGEKIVVPDAEVEGAAKPATEQK